MRTLSSSYCVLLVHTREALIGFPAGAVGKNLPAVQEMQFQSLGQEDSWRREWQPAPVFLPGEFHGQSEEPGGVQPRVGQDRVNNTDRASL